MKLTQIWIHFNLSTVCNRYEAICFWIQVWGREKNKQTNKKIVHLQGHAQPTPPQRWTVSQILGTEYNIQILLRRNVNIACVTATVFPTRTKHIDFGPNKQEDYHFQSQTDINT